MIVALAIPAYRQSVHARTAYCWAQDALTCAEFGWNPVLIWVDNSGIPRARNTIVKIAEEAGADLLLSCDSDSFALAPEGGLKHLWATMQRHNAAIVGAAMVTRNGSRMNCEPARPGESYEGEVGTGYYLADLRRLRDLPKPWFVHEDSDDGLNVKCGEDIHWMRLARKHGHTVIVDYTIPMGHADQSVSATDCTP